MILLFGNAFAAYATAYALTSGCRQPRADRDRQRLDGQRALEPARWPGARVRDVRRAAVMMLIYVPLQRRSAQVGEVRRASLAVRRHLAAARRRRTSSSRCSRRSSSASSRIRRASAAPGELRRDRPRRRLLATFKLSFLLALETIVLSLVLFVPTIYWVHLKLPKLRPVIAFIALIPFVVPPIVIVVGLLKFYKDTLAPPGSSAARRLPRRCLRDPRVPVHVLLARRRLPLHRRAHADRGVAEPRRGLADHALPRDPAEHPRRRAQRRRSSRSPS